MYFLFFYQTKYAGSVLDSRLIVLGLHLDMYEASPVGPVMENLYQNTEETDAVDQSENVVQVESRTLFYQDHTFHQDTQSSSVQDVNGQQQRQLWKDDIIDFITGIFWILESKSWPTTGVNPPTQVPKPKGLVHVLLPSTKSTLKKSGHLLVSGGNLADLCADLIRTPIITKERISKINAIINTTF